MRKKATLVFDTEANGLLHEADTMWCAVFYWKEEDRWFEFSTVSKKCVGLVPSFLECMAMRFDLTLVCHNQFGYDLPLMHKLLGLRFKWGEIEGGPVTYCDTLDLSRRLTPDRVLPNGCPISTPNPVTGKRRQVGPHSLEAWGYKLGNLKPQVHDWREGNIEDYLHRCKEDVTITMLLFDYLTEEFKRREGVK